jgi:hypothetical protein
MTPNHPVHGSGQDRFARKEQAGALRKPGVHVAVGATWHIGRLEEKASAWYPTP